MILIAAAAREAELGLVWALRQGDDKCASRVRRAIFTEWFFSGSSGAYRLLLIATNQELSIPGN